MAEEIEHNVYNAVASKWDETDDVVQAEFDAMDDEDDDLLAYADDATLGRQTKDKEEDMVVNLDGINFDEEMEAEDAANISIGLDSATSYPANDYDGHNSGFDFATGKLWIYPTNYPVRDYQYNIVQQALFKNTLVVLPTGLGKTFIAAVVMYNLYRWFPRGKIVFMAPTKPLVAQQIHACYDIMAIPKADTVEMTGTMAPAIRQKAWKEKRVVFLTPQVMTNDLSRGSLAAESVKCLVVDEAHKALGNHAYCQVVRELVKFTREFRILALSATPGGDLKAVQQVMNNLLISHIELRSEECIDIRPYTHERKIEKIVVPLGEELTGVRLQYIQIMTCVIQRLTRNRVLYNREATKLSKFLILKARDEFRQNPPQNMQQVQYGNIEANFALAISLYHGFELLQLHGLRSLYNFLMGIITGDKGYGRTRSELMRNADFNAIMETLRQKFSGSAMQGVSAAGDGKVVVGHPKMQKLEEIVVDHFRSFQKKGDETRVMIFSQYRDSVQEIAAILNQHQPLVKVMPFIGQSSTGKATKGYTQKEQLKVMRQFREGGYNTLVSTCVGEEGLDIGDVDLIVCFDAHKSPIRLVQRMGRTGRKRQGRIVMLVTQGKEEQIYNQSLYSKKSIHKAIQNGARSLNFYPNNPRLVPPSVTPQCHKMHITLPTLNSSKKKEKAPSTSRSAAGGKNRKISELFGKQVVKAPEDGYLTSAEYEEIRREFAEVPALAKHLPRPKCVILTLQKQEPENATDQPSPSKLINLSEWMPWQNRLQNTHISGHSTQSEHLVKDAEFLEVQHCIGEEQDSYGLEMRRFLNKDDIIHNEADDSVVTQSSIVSFFGLVDNNSTNVQESDAQVVGNSKTADSKVRKQHEKGNKKGISESRGKNAREGHAESVLISSESSSDELPHGLGERNRTSKSNVSKLLTVVKNSKNKSGRVDSAKKLVEKSKKSLSKSQVMLSGRPSMKAKLLQKKKGRDVMKSERKLGTLRQTSKTSDGKRKSILQLLESNVPLIPSTKDSDDFECDEGGGLRLKDMSIKDELGRNDAGKMTLAENDKNLDISVADDYRTIEIDDDDQPQSDQGFGKTSHEEGTLTAHLTQDFENIRSPAGSELSGVPLIQLAPPVSEVKDLFCDIKSGASFAAIDLEKMVEEWNSTENEKVCEIVRSKHKEFMSGRAAPSCSKGPHSSRSNLLDASFDTKLLKSQDFHADDNDYIADIVRTSPNEYKHSNPDKAEKSALQKSLQKQNVKNHTSSEKVPANLPLSDSLPKSPAFKSLTCKIEEGKHSKVRKSISFSGSQRKDNVMFQSEKKVQNNLMTASSNHTCSGAGSAIKSKHETVEICLEKVETNSLMENTFMNMSDSFAFNLDDIDMEAYALKTSVTAGQTSDNMHIKKATSAGKNHDHSQSFVTFTQAMECLQTSSSENSLDDVDISTPQMSTNNLANASRVVGAGLQDCVSRSINKKEALKTQAHEDSGLSQMQAKAHTLKQIVDHSHSKHEILANSKFGQASRRPPSFFPACQNPQTDMSPNGEAGPNCPVIKHAEMVTPKKHSDSSPDGLDMPQFDLGFDLDDDVIPPTPPKDLSQASSLFSFRTHPSVTNSPKEPVILLSQKTNNPSVLGSHNVFQNHGASQMNASCDKNLTNQSKLPICDDNDYMQLSDNDLNVELVPCDVKRHSSNLRSEPILEAPSAFERDITKDSDNCKTVEPRETKSLYLSDCSDIEITPEKAKQLKTVTKVKVSAQRLEAADFCKDISNGVLTDKDTDLFLEKDEIGISQIAHKGLSNNPVISAQCEDKESNEMSLPSSPKRQKLPFSQYASSSDAHDQPQNKYLFHGTDTYNEMEDNRQNSSDTSPAFASKARTGKLRLGKRQNRFREANSSSHRKSSDDVTVTTNFHDTEPVGKKYGNLVYHSKRSSLAGNEKSHNGVVQDVELIDSCDSKALNLGDQQDAEPVFVSRQGEHSAYKKERSGMMQMNGVKSSTPVRPSYGYRDDLTPEAIIVEDETVPDLTPIRRVHKRADEEEQEESDESFIIRRRKKPAALSVLSDNDENAEKTSPTSARKQPPAKLSLREMNTPVVERTGKLNLLAKKQLAILDDCDEMDDFEDSTSVMVPPKPVLEKKDGRKRKWKKKGSEFVEKEAEVSGDDASSDENEGNDDYYEGSFVDDNTEMTQAHDTDMRAFYLKSVKSPPVGGHVGRYRLCNNKHSDMDIYSQALPEDHGMSEYEEDSFCVGSDEDEISYAEEESQVEELSRRTRRHKTNVGKSKKKEGKRRIKLLSDSSSDEEAEVRLPATQEFSTQNHKFGRRVLLSSSEDESEVRRSGSNHHQSENENNISASNRSITSNSVHKCVGKLPTDQTEELHTLDIKETSMMNMTKIKPAKESRHGVNNIQHEEFMETGNFNLLNEDDWSVDFDFPAVSSTNKIAAAKSSYGNQISGNEPAAAESRVLSLKNRKNVKCSDGKSNAENDRNNFSTRLSSTTSVPHVAFGIASSTSDLSHGILKDNINKECNSDKRFQFQSGQTSESGGRFQSPMNVSNKNISGSLATSTVASMSSVTAETSHIMNSLHSVIASGSSSSAKVSGFTKPSVSMTREERLRKQKEKQEKFRQKLKQVQQMQQIQNSSSTSNAGVSPGFATGSSTTSAEVDDVTGVCRLSRTSSVVSTDSYTSAKTSPVFTKIVELNGQNEQLQILVDSREISGAQDIISFLRLKHGIKVTARQLSSCDYILSNHLAVDRVQWSTFSNSNNRNKLSQRLCEMQALYDRCVLIVEADKLKAGQEKAKKPVSHTKYLDTTLAYIAQSRVKMYFTDTAEETATLLSDLCHVEGRKGRALIVPASPSPRKEEMLNFLLSIPKVTVPQALNLTHRFRSVAELVSSPASVIQERGCMTLSIAQSVYKFLRHQFDLQMLPDTKR